MGPRKGVPRLCGSGWGVSGVSGFGGRVRVPEVSCGGKGWGLFLARPGLFPVPRGLLGGGEEKVPGHLVEGGAARVFHPNGTTLPPMDTADGALLYPGGVGDLSDRPDDWIVGTAVLLLSRCTPNLGDVGLVRGVEGCAVAVLGGVGQFGGGDGLRSPCGGGRGTNASPLSNPDSKENLRFFGGDWGGGVGLRLGLGGVVRS